MLTPAATDSTLRAENAELRARLDEAEQTLRAIRAGEVDALVVDGDAGPLLYTLQGVDAEQNRFRGEMLAQVSDAVVVVDTVGRVTFLNAAAEHQYGVHAADVLGRRLPEIYTRCWPSPEAEADMQAALSEHDQWRGELVHRCADGREFPVEVSMAVLRGADGECTGRISAIRDVAYRIKIQHEKAEALRLLETLLKHAPVGFVFLDRDLRFVHINERLAEMNGYPVAAHLGKSMAELLPSLEATTREVTGRILATGQPVLDHEFTGKTARWPGSTRHWNESWYPVRNEGGEIIGFGAVVEDITERKQADAALRLLNERFDLAVKCSKVALFQEDLELRYRWVHNPVPEFEGAQIVGKRDADVLERPEEAALGEALKREVIRSGVGKRQEMLIHIQNAARYFDVMMEPVRDAAGIISGITSAAIDITERKKAEQAQASLQMQLQESQKMEAIGTLAAGIAHDFNNIIGTILVNAELARRDAAANYHALVSLREIEKAGHHARELVRQIVSFSRRQPTLHHVVSLRLVVEESMQLLRATLPGGIRLEYRCAADTPAVLADSTQVTQVLLNLVTNAAQAMAGRPGSIDIRVEGMTLDETGARAERNLHVGRYARIVVSDTGRGMDAATRRRIFEPFFTTKPAGAGTGLGLSVVHGIMLAHHGSIVVQSEPGRGSAFELYFPCADESAAALEMTEGSGPASEGRGRHILYIDDDEGQLFGSKRMLERWGYRVSAYLEQREALDAVLAGKLRFDLVVTDFNMPGATGLEIARAIHDVLPDLPVIMVSGYITDDLRAQAESAGVRQLIAKPQDLEELRDAVQDVFYPLLTKAPDRNQPRQQR